MTTSSFDRNRCTRISPSAVLDDRLDGKDLEWARDHLRRCEACRERVEDFREMLLRVGRLPSAGVGAAAMDQAYAVSIPERLRGKTGRRSFEIAAAEPAPGMTALPELPTPMRPELTSVPDLLSELERDIFGDEPAMDHPTPLTSSPEVAHPILPEVEPVTSPTWREVEVDSHRQAERLDWNDQPEAIAEPEPVTATPEPDPLLAAPEPEPILAGPEPEPILAAPEPEPILAAPEPEPILAAPEPEPMLAASASEPVAWRYQPEPVAPEAAVPVSSNVVYGEDPAELYAQDEVASPAPPARKPDTAMRIAVGLGAAACVLLAAVLYEGGWLSKSIGKLGATNTAATASVRASAAHPSPTIRASASSSTAPTAPPAPVLFTLGNAVSGGTVFRIRPGTAIAGYTRLVFDIRGGGLPTMVITRPDDLHVAMTFKNTTTTGVPVSGIRSYQVAAIEPAVQQGSDGTITVDLAQPVRVTAFTLTATGSYAWRLVVDLHSS